MKKRKRRDFLKTAAVAGGAAVAGFPTIVKASTLGKNGALPASDRIVMAGIGFGMMGPGNMEAFLEKNEVQWVAVCDLDDEPLARARDTVNKKYGAKDCATYKDFRELFLRRAALGRELPPGLRARPQRPRGQDPARRGRPPVRPL